MILSANGVTWQTMLLRTDLSHSSLANSTFSTTRNELIFLCVVERVGRGLREREHNLWSVVLDHVLVEVAETFHGRAAQVQLLLLPAQLVYRDQFV